MHQGPLTHTLGFLLPSFGMVTNVSIGKSFVAKVGGSSSMLHESNLLEFVFQGSLHGNERVVVHFIAISEEEDRKDAQAQLVPKCQLW